MAKYSREQRDRAVDLYIKYERCVFCFNVCSTGSAVFFRSVG